MFLWYLEYRVFTECIKTQYDINDQMTTFL